MANGLLGGRGTTSDPDYDQGMVDRLFQLVGRGRRSPVDVARAARELGVARSTISRMLRGQSGERAEQALAQAERAERHRPQWVQQNDRGTTADGMLKQLGARLPDERDIPGQLRYAGVLRPDGSLDVRATARQFNVAPSTVRGWLAGRTRPRENHQETLRREVRTRGLTRSTTARQQAAIGARIEHVVYASVSQDPPRRRRIAIHLDPAGMQAAHRAYAAGGEDGLQEFLELDLAANYARGLTDWKVTSWDQLNLR